MAKEPQLEGSRSDKDGYVVFYESVWRQIIMKKILALTVAGVLLACSSLSVCAAEDTTSSGSNSVTTDDLMKQIEELQASLEKAIKDSEDSSKEQITTLRESVATLRENVVTMQEKIQDLKEQIATLESSESANTEKIEELNEKMEEYEKALTEYEEELYVNTAQLAKLTTEVQNLANAINAGGGKSSGSSGKSGGSGGGGGGSSSSANDFYKRNNIIGYGSTIVGQGGHVEINGGKSNVTFVLTPATGGQLTAATGFSAGLGGALLNVVNTSSPGASFKTAKVNFYVSGVNAGDNIAVYQLQGNKWVQLPVVETRKDHVIVNMTRHGTVAFIRVPVLAYATN